MICISAKLRSEMVTTPAVGGERAPHKHIDAGQCQAFRPRGFMADKWIAVTPLRTGTGIKQHADDRQIELRAGSCDWIAKIFEQIFVTVHTVWREMPPARMERHVERRIILLHNR